MTALVYRAYDVADALLYVGVTTDPDTRMRNHKARAPWWEEMTIVDFERFSTVTAAFDAESDAIVSESPLYNSRGERGPKDGTLQAWGRKIRVTRRSLALNQTQLGALLDPAVNQSTVNRWERGLIEPNRVNKRELARVLDVNVDEFFSYDVSEALS